MLEHQKRQAILVLKEFQRGIDKKNNRIHEEELDNNALLLRAFDTGICGNCRFVKAAYYNLNGRRRVDIMCQVGYTPRELYRQTPLGRVPNCPGFVAT